MDNHANWSLPVGRSLKRDLRNELSGFRRSGGGFEFQCSGFRFQCSGFRSKGRGFGFQCCHAFLTPDT